MRAILTLLSITILLSSCKKEDEIKRSVYDLDMLVELRDKDGNKADYFDEDDDLYFYFSMSNPVNEAIGYYYKDVLCQNPEFGFEVYTTDDNKLVGTVHPTEPNCLAVLKRETIEANEHKEYLISWLEPMMDENGMEVTNNKLPRGYYYLKFSMTVEDYFLDGRNELPGKRPVAETIYFAVK